MANKSSYWEGKSQNKNRVVTLLEADKACMALTVGDSVGEVVGDLVGCDVSQDVPSPIHPSGQAQV